MPGIRMRIGKIAASVAIWTTLFAGGAMRAVAADSEAKALRPSELLALVAGNGLPENVVHEITVDGLAFRPNDSYRTLLKTAGADTKILAAVNSAKVVAEVTPEADSGKDLLQHIANAGSFIREKRYEEATNELTSAVKASFKSPECGFVMAHVLRMEEQWEAAAGVYNGVLRMAPDFPEVHAKLSFVLYRLNDFETGLTEAHAALN